MKSKVRKKNSTDFLTTNMRSDYSLVYFVDLRFEIEKWRDVSPDFFPPFLMSWILHTVGRSTHTNSPRGILLYILVCTCPSNLIRYNWIFCFFWLYNWEICTLSSIDARNRDVEASLNGNEIESSIYDTRVLVWKEEYCRRMRYAYPSAKGRRVP